MTRARCETGGKKKSQHTPPAPTNTPAEPSEFQQMEQLLYAINHENLFSDESNSVVPELPCNQVSSSESSDQNEEIAYEYFADDSDSASESEDCVNLESEPFDECEPCSPKSLLPSPSLAYAIGRLFSSEAVKRKHTEKAVPSVSELLVAELLPKAKA